MLLRNSSAGLSVIVGEDRAEREQHERPRMNGMA